MTIAKRIVNQPSNLGDGSIPLLLSEKEAALFLGVSVSFLRKSRCDGALKGRTSAPPFVRVRGRCYYRLADLIAWVADLAPQQVI